MAKITRPKPMPKGGILGSNGHQYGGGGKISKRKGKRKSK